MKQKKMVQLFIIISLILISPLPVLNLFFFHQKDALKSENITIQKLFNADHMEANTNFFAYRSLHLSLNKRQVIVGKDGFLFLGNQYENILDKPRDFIPTDRQTSNNGPISLRRYRIGMKQEEFNLLLSLLPIRVRSIQKNFLIRLFTVRGKRSQMIS